LNEDHYASWMMPLGGAKLVPLPLPLPLPLHLFLLP
jgi:hypothetical protein